MSSDRRNRHSKASKLLQHDQLSWWHTGHIKRQQSHFLVSKTLPSVSKRLKPWYEAHSQRPLPLQEPVCWPVVFMVWAKNLSSFQRTHNCRCFKQWADWRRNYCFAAASRRRRPQEFCLIAACRRCWGRSPGQTAWGKRRLGWWCS